MTFRTRRLSKNRLKSFEPIGPEDGTELPVRFGNIFECTLCNVTMNSEENHTSHIEGRKHLIRKLLSKYDFKKLTTDKKERLVSTDFLTTLLENRLDLCCYGMENFVEFVEENQLLLFCTATNTEFKLPLYKKPDPKPVPKVNKDDKEDGELLDGNSKEESKKDFIPLPQEYYDFVEMLQQYYHLAHSVRSGSKSGISRPSLRLMNFICMNDFDPFKVGGF